MDDKKMKKEIEDPQLYEKYMILNNCPITEIQIVTDAYKNRHKFKYIYIKFVEGYYIGFSKFSNDLPLTQFVIGEGMPCKDVFSPVTFTKFRFEHT